MNSTADFVTDTITAHFKYLGKDFAILPEDEFEDCFYDYPQARYGWTFPEIGMYCADRIARQIDHLTQDDQLDYLRAVLWMVDRHIVLFHEDPDRSSLDRHREIESELYDTAPASMTLLSEVEMKALDDG